MTISYRDGIHMLRLALVQAECAIPKGESAFIGKVISATDHLMDPALEEKTIASPMDNIIAWRFAKALNFHGIPLPELMFNDDGEVGMYWDNNIHYRDIDVGQDGTVSLYGRDRDTKAEQWCEKIAVGDITGDWVDKYMAPFRLPSLDKIRAIGFIKAHEVNLLNRPGVDGRLTTMMTARHHEGEIAVYVAQELIK